MDIESMYMATLKLAIVGVLLNSLVMSTKAGSTMEEPIGAAAPAKATIAVIVHFCFREKSCAFVISGKTQNLARSPRRSDLGTTIASRLTERVEECARLWLPRLRERWAVTWASWPSETVRCESSDDLVEVEKLRPDLSILEMSSLSGVVAAGSGFRGSAVELP